MFSRIRSKSDAGRSVRAIERNDSTGPTEKVLWADDVSRTQAKPRAAYDYYQHLLLFLFLSLCSTTHLIGRRHNNIQHVVNHLTDRPSLQFSPVLWTCRDWVKTIAAWTVAGLFIKVYIERERIDLCVCVYKRGIIDGGDGEFAVMNNAFACGDWKVPRSQSAGEREREGPIGTKNVRRTGVPGGIVQLWAWKRIVY